MDLFTRFDGRISRRGFWLGLLGVVAVSIVVGLGLISALPGGVILSLGQIIVSAGIIYIWSAVLVKRLHDRGKPALPWVIIFLLPGVLAQIINILKIGYTAVELAGTQVMVPGLGATIVMWVSMAIGLWMVIELGFLKGVSGPNAYGPDPLSGPTEAQAA